MIGGMLAGALIFAAGALAGRLWPARRKGPRPVRPVCGCDHHRSFHNAETGECHALMDGSWSPVRDERGRPVLDDYGHVQRATEKVPCGCRRYTGPEPLPEFYAPEIPG